MNVHITAIKRRSASVFAISTADSSEVAVLGFVIEELSLLLRRPSKQKAEA